MESSEICIKWAASDAAVLQRLVSVYGLGVSALNTRLEPCTGIWHSHRNHQRPPRKLCVTFEGRLNGLLSFSLRPMRSLAWEHIGSLCGGNGTEGQRGRQPRDAEFIDSLRSRVNNKQQMIVDRRINPMPGETSQQGRRHICCLRDQLFASRRRSAAATINDIQMREGQEMTAFTRLH